MAASSFTPALLDLPLELKLKIYQMLLCPDPHKVYTLYHDRHGRGDAFSVHPAILRVNRQLHSEAVSLLYNSNLFEIYLATGVMETTSLMDHWRGGKSAGLVKDHTKLLRKPLNEETRKEGQISLDTGVEGIIYPHCLQRIRHLSLVTSRSAMIGWDAGSIDDPYVTQTGELILEILRYLCEESAPMEARRKRLHLTIMSNWELEGVKKGDYAERLGYLDDGPAIEFGKPLLAGVRVGNMREEVRKMIVLLRRIQTSRIVRVDESVVRSLSDLRPTTQEINLGHFRYLGI